MDITLLARRRAEAASRLEALAGLGPSRDPEESREMAIATTQAHAAYREAEIAFQAVAGTLTEEELASAGLTP